MLATHGYTVHPRRYIGTDRCFDVTDIHGRVLATCHSEQDARDLARLPLLESLLARCRRVIESGDLLEQIDRVLGGKPRAEEVTAD